MSDSSAPAAERLSAEELRAEQALTGRRIPNPPPHAHPQDMVDVLFPHYRAALGRPARSRRNLLLASASGPQMAPFVLTKGLVASLLAGAERIIDSLPPKSAASAAEPTQNTEQTTSTRPDDFATESAPESSASAADAAASSSSSASSTAAAPAASSSKAANVALKTAGRTAAAQAGRWLSKADWVPGTVSWPRAAWLALALRSACHDTHPRAPPPPRADAPGAVDLRQAVVFVSDEVAAACAVTGEDAVAKAAGTAWSCDDLVVIPTPTAPTAPAAAAAAATAAHAATGSAAETTETAAADATADATTPVTAAVAAVVVADAAAEPAVSVPLAPAPPASWTEWASLYNSVPGRLVIAVTETVRAPRGWLLLHPAVSACALPDARAVRALLPALCARARALLLAEPYVPDCAPARAALPPPPAIATAGTAGVPLALAGLGAAVGPATQAAQDAFARASERSWVHAETMDAASASTRAAADADAAASAASAAQGEAAAAALAARDVSDHGNAHNNSSSEGGAFAKFRFALPPAMLTRLSRSRCPNPRGACPFGAKPVHLYCPECRVPALPPAELTPLLEAAQAEAEAESSSSNGSSAANTIPHSSAETEEEESAVAAGDRKRRRVASSDDPTTTAAPAPASASARSASETATPAGLSGLQQELWPHRRALLRLFGPARAAGAAPAPLLGPRALPVCVTLVHHWQEKLTKSTGLHGCVLAPAQCELNAHPEEVPPFDPATTVVLYPSADACAIDDDLNPVSVADNSADSKNASAPVAEAASASSASAPVAMDDDDNKDGDKESGAKDDGAADDNLLQRSHGYAGLRAPVVQMTQQARGTTVDWGRVTRLVLLEATWQKAPGMILHPHLRDLPRVKLAPRVSTFWRHQELGAAYLATVEAAYYACVEVHERRLRDAARANSHNDAAVIAAAAAAAAATADADAAAAATVSSAGAGVGATVHPAARADTAVATQYRGQFDDLLLLYAARHSRVVDKYKGVAAENVLAVWRSSVAAAQAGSGTAAKTDRAHDASDSK